MKTITIRPKLLVAINAFIPIGFLFIAIDAFLLDGDLKKSLPDDPNDFLLFTLIFTLPHIMASFFGFADREYLATYGKRLLHGAQAIVIVAIALPLISADLTFFVFALFTMTHVFLQQSGVSKSLMKGANHYHRYWQWVSVLIALLLYLAVYTTYIPDNDLWRAGLIGLIGIQTLLGYQAAQASKTNAGKWFFWATHSLVVASYIFFAVGYPILTIAIPRIIHDLTAFCFYIAHDHNRLADKPSNYIYRSVQRLGIPVLVASPVLAIVLAAPFQYSSQSTDLFILSMFLFLYHYYVESFIWKRGSLHRRYANPL